MDQRLSLYALAAKYQLDAATTQQLQQLAAPEAIAIASRLPKILAVAAAALFGLGLVFWIAANWDTLGRAGHFVLLQALCVLLCTAAIVLAKARIPLCLLAFLSVGGLFAYFGQAYQTGADPWQLFAIWAALTLPLCLSTQSDALWTPWALIVSTGISLWIHAHTGHRWRLEQADTQVFLLGWSAALLMTLMLSPKLPYLKGTGHWAFRTSMTLCSVMICSSAFTALLADDVLLLYFSGLLLFALATAAMAQPATFDIYGLSIIGLCLNILLISGLTRLLFNGHNNDNFIGQILLIGLAAAVLLAFTVSTLLRLSRRQANTL
ncbi:DUF2157 domain-containing protein [Iodobacter fluviatilis]|uniref:Membrane protein DUF2157 n=1 Tax=Iodobacter fluviatilis TaxID=537 RepID=A0A377Q9M7_9NEIS|nr:DUF2157 domain-containing protein [Iodobacter fluviatilis]TCU88499.1 putative membrane protein DUF2157 [Iodobacter fluviatilis]STQ91430.1 Predicted membrane protein [Iodobacter fluviatilis]